MFNAKRTQTSTRGTELLIVILYLNLLDLPRIEQESAKVCEEMRKGKIKKKKKPKFYTPIILPDKLIQKIVVQASLSRVKEALHVARHCVAVYRT